MIDRDVILDRKHFIITNDEEAFITSPDNSRNNHIKSVDVYSSNDNYDPLLGAVRCHVDRVEGALVTQPIKKSLPHQVGRFRYEPAVRITLEEECGDNENKTWYLYIYHHKGTVCLKSELASLDRLK